MNSARLLHIPPILPTIIPFSPWNASLKKPGFQLAVNAFKKGQFKIIKAAALAFNISKSTFRRRIHHALKKQQITKNYQKLKNPHFHHGF